MKNITPGLLLLTTLLSIGGCSRQSRRLDGRVFSVFAGFTLVSDGAYTSVNGQQAEVNTAVAKHGDQALPLPERPQIGRLYVFHQKRPQDVERLALSDFPKTLQAEGFQIVKKPTGPQDMMSLYYGGPLFMIKFKQQNHIGFIFNQICPEAKNRDDMGWDIHDYVLVFTK